MDGLAVVSDIVADKDPYNAAKRIATIIQAFKAHPITCFSKHSISYTIDTIKVLCGTLLYAVKHHTPLVHQVRAFHVDASM